MNKYIIMASFALGAILTGCTKNEVALSEGDREINFQVANYASQTKANSGFGVENTFGVYSWFDGEQQNEKDQTMMVNECVSYVSSETSSQWKPAGTYYWPKTGDVDFFAYAPYADTKKSQTPWISIDDNAHKLTAARTVIEGYEDYMYSSMAMNYSANPNAAYGFYGVTAGVPILFHHALAKLTVEFAASEVAMGTTVWDITVNSAEFVNVCNAGTLAMDIEIPAEKPNILNETGLVGWTLPENSIWAGSTAPADSSALKIAENFLLTKEFSADKINGRAVLPQNLAKMKFHINFTIKASNDGRQSYYSTETIDRTYDVATIFSEAGSFWKMNTDVTYRITIAPNTEEVYFDPAVDAWTVGTSVSGSVTL